MRIIVRGILSLVLAGLAAACDSSSGGADGGAGTGGAAAGGNGGTAGTGSGGTAGTGGGGSAGTGSGGQGVLCDGTRCLAGEMCCYDLMGSGTCAAPPAVCTGAPATCNNAQSCTGALFCDITQPRRCGASGAAGICIETPTACTRIYLPVCGCDGVTYGNDCERRRARAQLDHEGACP